MGSAQPQRALADRRLADLHPLSELPHPILVKVGELAVSLPGSTSHYAHREHLAGRTIKGEAVLALCGTHFVPTQDHDSLPQCPTCQERLAEL